MQARADLEKKRSRAKEIRETGIVPPSKDALSIIIPEFKKFQKVRLSPESYARTENILDLHVLPYFGKMPMNLISRDTISQYASERVEIVSPGTVIKELGVIKRLFSYLLDEKRLIPYNPAARLKPPRKAPAGRVRYLQPTELRAVIDACPDWLRGIVGLAAFTGMRRSEILNLRWLNVDMHGSRLMLSQTKNGEARIVYLNGLACEVIESQYQKGAKPTDKVFPHTDGFSADNVSKGFAVVCRNLEIHDFHFHDLRHTAASWMRMQGAGIDEVADLLGHKDLRMAKRYQHLSPGHLATAVGRLDSIFGEPKVLTEG